MKTRRRIVLALLAVVAALAYVASGLFVVAPGEIAVVRRLGRITPRLSGPGLHLGWPLGLDRVTLIKTDEVRRLTVGLPVTPGVGDEPGAGEYLTGDLNLLRTRATVQYRVSDPARFTLRAVEVEPLLMRLSEASLTRSLARQGIDATLHDGRFAASREAEAELSRLADGYGLGLTILGVSLTDTRPPGEVAPDFAAAQSARSEHDRRVNEAKTLAATTVTKAESDARARLEKSRAGADRTLALAKSRAGRFTALLAEATKSRGLTVRRIYLDAVRELLPKVGRKIVLTPDEPLDLSIFGTNSR